MWLKGRRSFPVWDLVAAMYLIAPSMFEVDTQKVTWNQRGYFEYGQEQLHQDGDGRQGPFRSDASK